MHSGLKMRVFLKNILQSLSNAKRTSDRPATCIGKSVADAESL